jgi:hypothetical protein
MDDKEIKKLLLRLLDEIKNTQAVDEKGEKLLHDLEGDINELIARTEETPGRLGAPSVQNLESALAHFEVTHPQMTLLISNLLNFLSNSGI